MQFLPPGNFFWRRKLPGSVPPKVLESHRGKLRITDRVLDVLVTQVVLDRTCIVPIVGQFITCSMTQHVSMDREWQLSSHAKPFYQLLGAVNRRASAIVGLRLRV